MLEHLTIAKKSSVLTLHEEWYTQLKIAEKLKINQATVSRIIQNSLKKTFERKKGSGRVKLLSEHREKFMKDLLIKPRKSGQLN